MADGLANPASIKGQPSLLRLPLILVHHKSKRRRVRRVYLPLTFKRGLLLSFRNFRTLKARRSTNYSQLAIPVYWLPIRELSVRSIDRRAANKLLASTKVISQPRTWLRWQFLTGCVLLMLGVYGAVHYALLFQKPSSLALPKNEVPSAPIQSSSSNSVVGPVLPASAPTYLSIPSVDINTPLNTVGLKADGSIEVPSDYHEAGWYKYSPTPGQLGPSIIVGHVDNVNGLGVFWELRNVKVGDTIQITRADGNIHTFRVINVVQVPKDNFPTAEIYGNINYAGLRLITCGGVFNTATHEYNLNTVVFAALVS